MSRYQLLLLIQFYLRGERRLESDQGGSDGCRGSPKGDMMGFKSLLKTGIVLIPVLLSQVASAQAVLKEELKKTDKKWGVTTSLTGTSSLHKPSDENHTEESRFTLAPNYKITKDLKISASASMIQELNGGKKSSLSNTRLSLRQSPRKVTNDIVWFPTLFTDLATDVEGRKNRTYRGNLAGQATAVGTVRVFDHNFSVIPMLRYTRNFHRLTRDANDTANIRESTLTSLILETSLIKRLSLSAGGSYNYGWTYQNSTRESFSLSQELAYEIDSALSIAIGHSNDANVFAANGQQNNVKLFDENTSAVYLTVQGVY